MHSIKDWLSILMDNYKVRTVRTYVYVCVLMYTHTHKPPSTPPPWAFAHKHPCTSIHNPLPHTQTQMLLYNGQLDIVVGPTLTESMLQVLEWSGKDDFLHAKRTVSVLY